MPRYGWIIPHQPMFTHVPKNMDMACFSHTNPPQKKKRIFLRKKKDFWGTKKNSLLSLLKRTKKKGFSPGVKKMGLLNGSYLKRGRKTPWVCPLKWDWNAKNHCGVAIIMPFFQRNFICGSIEELQISSVVGGWIEPTHFEKICASNLDHFQPKGSGYIR